MDYLKYLFGSHFFVGVDHQNSRAFLYITPEFHQIFIIENYAFYPILCRAQRAAPAR